MLLSVVPAEQIATYGLLFSVMSVCQALLLLASNVFFEYIDCSIFNLYDKENYCINAVC